MAAKKRSKKTPAKQKRGLISRLVRAFCWICVLALVALGASYYFGSFETRTKITDAAKRALNEARMADWMPKLISSGIDQLYDTVPHSVGLVVDGGELGRTLSPILAGLPQSRTPIRVLENKSYINLYDERTKQPRCIALRLTDADAQKATITQAMFKDPRVAGPSANELTTSGWQATRLAPAAALAKEFGSDGAGEANLSTNYLPLPSPFIEGLWQEATRTLTQDYPKRFDEVWIYSGPIYDSSSGKLASGIRKPSAIYCIAFDLSETGGLRAIAFVLPTNAPTEISLKDCISSIAAIEQASGLSFLPEIGFDARDLLLNWVSPQLW